MPRHTMPRLAGISPKLRPSVSLPAMMITSPTPETAAVARSGIRPPPVGRMNGTPTIEMVAIMRAAQLRSMTVAGRRTTVSSDDQRLAHQQQQTRQVAGLRVLAADADRQQHEEHADGGAGEQVRHALAYDSHSSLRA